MGVFDTLTVTDQSLKIDSLVNYLNGLDGISASESTETYNDTEYTGALFYVDGTNIQGFFGYNDDKKITYAFLKNGDIYYVNGSRGQTGDSCYTGTLYITSYIGDGCKVISIGDDHYKDGYASSTKEGFEFAVVETTKSKILVGYLRNNTSSFQDIASLTYEDVSDVARVNFTYTNMFPYSAPAGTLDFLAQAYFVNGGVRKHTTEAMKECSELILLSTASLPAPLGNHVAIGTHCIVPITEEGGNE